MAKLYFRYGAMGSSKTANALMVRYNYEEKGQYAVILKPRLDKRDGAKTIYSRIGLQAEGEFVETFLEKVSREWMPCLQDGILTADQVDLLSELVDYFDIPVICYGLRTDFRGMLFEGSRRLLEIADRIEEIPTVCWCGRRAHFNARFSDGKILRTGAQIFLGANESYVSLCRKHYKEGKLREE